MNARELIALNEQIIAFNVIMKQSLKDEIDAATVAIAALGDAQGIQAAKDKLAADLASFGTMEAEAQAHYDNEQAKLDEATQVLVSAQTQLAQDQATLRVAQDVLAQGQAQLDVDKAASAQYFATEQVKLAEAQALCDSDRASLNDAFNGIAQRESAVAQKLAAMKAIV